MGIASSRPRGPPPPPGEDSREIDDSGVGPKIPQALEKILQLKEIRQEELTSVPGAIDDDMETELRMLAGISASDAEDDASALSKKEVRGNWAGSAGTWEGLQLKRPFCVDMSGLVHLLRNLRTSDYLRLPCRFP
ncbi:splicing factor 3B subunit 2 [Notechis scutatus]|uniref:Splicing factor 3B subunit 2 n=1 Tax=Notechis scutatus TaxID=8663 RepID=A0A6J1VK34_9SAUR|nr:splicing factor 3B subunit 2 [Notechis scutatus]